MLWGVFYQLVVINSITYRQQVTPEPCSGGSTRQAGCWRGAAGWTGGAFLAGALVGWLGLVPTLFVAGLHRRAGDGRRLDLAAAGDGHG